MDARPIVFALVLGWVAGKEQLPGDFISWLEADQAKSFINRTADCTALGVDFKLVQPAFDFRPVP
jgi:hypothetical protein